MYNYADGNEGMLLSTHTLEEKPVSAEDHTMIFQVRRTDTFKQESTKIL